MILRAWEILWSVRKLQWCWGNLSMTRDMQDKVHISVGASETIQHASL
jgi:hypothetical protein